VKLYKFMKAKLCRKVLNGRVRFTEYVHLNDPYETEVSLTPQALRRSLEALRKRGLREDEIAALKRQEMLLRRVAPEFVRISATQLSDEQINRVLNLSIYENADFMISEFRDLQNRLRERVGLFCLSARWESHLMWAHYADSHRGVVVEFDRLEDAFSGDETELLGEVKQVLYSEDVPQLDFFTRSTELLFLTKSREWEYEKEFRILLPVSECYPDGNQDDPIYLYELRRDRISSVIFGLRMPDNEKQEIEMTIRNDPLLHHVRMFQVAPCPGQFLLTKTSA